MSVKLEEAIGHHQSGRQEEAERHGGMGDACYALQRMEDAVACYETALAHSPENAEWLFRRGNALQVLGRLVDSVASYRQALEIRPDHAETHCNMGDALQAQGAPAEAIDCYRRAIGLNPDHAQAHANMAMAQHALGRLDDAIESARNAVRIKPDFIEACCNLGNALKDAGRIGEAIDAYRQGLAVNPDSSMLLSNLGNAFQAQGRLQDAIDSYRQALALNPSLAGTHSNLIFTLDMSRDVDTAALQAERRNWERMRAANAVAQTPFEGAPDPARRLRVGYVSADLCSHSASVVFGAMLVNFDRRMFDVIAYSNWPGEDWLNDLFRKNATEWRNIHGLSDDAVADLIRRDRIDILVDLSGHSAGNRLLVFARKPAPIQVTAWGYIGGTGMSAMDAFLADATIVPPHEAALYAEEIRYLPCAISAFFPESFPEVGSLPAMVTTGRLSATSGLLGLLWRNARDAIGLSRRATVHSGGNDIHGGAAAGITFGSLNRLAKISPEVMKTWAAIMKRVPGSRMVLKSMELGDENSRKLVLECFGQAGIAPDRLTLLGRTSATEHRSTFNRIDLALDPYPHGGGVTTLEGLMMGVPVVTLRWPTVPGRLSASILTTLGLEDWIAESEEEYMEIAVRKAGDLRGLAELRKQLRYRLQESIIGDAEAYVKEVEKEYRALWREWCARQVKEG